MLGFKSESSKSNDRKSKITSAKSQVTGVYLPGMYDTDDETEVGALALGDTWGM